MTAVGCWTVGGATARGAAHLRRNIANQDAILWLPESGTGPHVVAAVADGHGAAAHPNSEHGARLAVETAGTVLDWFLADDPSDAAAADLAAQTVSAWQDAVRQHAAQSGWVEPLGETLVSYGTTLLATAASDALVLTLQIGDGDIYLGYPDGTIEKPLEDDRGLVGEQTYSLCAPDAPARFRVAVRRVRPGRAAPDFALLATDGVAKSFSDDAAFRDVVARYRDLAHSSDMITLQESLPGWLTELSRRGSGDDATLCLLVRRLS